MGPCFVVIHADDGALVASSAEDLQYMLDVLKSYCAKWRMFVNTAKTKVIKFESSSVQVGDIKFVYNGAVLEEVTSFK